MLYPSQTVFYPSQTVLYSSQTVLYPSWTVLYLSQTVLYPSQTVLYPSWPVIWVRGGMGASASGFAGPPTPETTVDECFPKGFLAKEIRQFGLDDAGSMKDGMGSTVGDPLENFGK